MQKYIIKTPPKFNSKCCRVSTTQNSFRAQERNFPLPTYFHSHKTYRFLSPIFSLLSVSILHLWMRKIPVTVGWSKETLPVVEENTVLATEKGSLWHAVSCNDNQRTSSLWQSLWFHWKDFGEHGKSLKRANHVLVFMIEELVRKRKTVLEHLFYSRIRGLHETSIKKIQFTGSKVIATVCDQQSVHRSLFQNLGMSTR